MDFVEGFLRVHGKSVVLTVVDRFSKYAHFITLGHPYTVTLVAHAFFAEIMRLHGLLSSVVSDYDATFTSTFWRELFLLSDIRLNMSMAFHPQSNRQSEAVNKVIMMYLRCLSGDRPC
jgi:transposase InsO family protein